MLAMAVAAAMSLAVSATPGHTIAPDHTIYVSKLGSGKDGRSWVTAYTTIQAALSAVPAGGGYRIAIRPDTYFEANLFPANRGAAGAYNEIVGDTDGRLGSGAKGRIVIDSGAPEQRGFKSYDWWGTIRATSQGWSKEHTDPTFSAIGWDRWRFASLYVTGSDAGIFFDTTNRKEPFSVVVEDCVSIGRAFGGGVAGCLSRPDEPITFRRCWLWSLDFWGDTAGAYIRVENDTMPTRPDAVLEDCTLVGPQCAYKSSNYGFHTYTHSRLTRCRLITLNFSQPVGTPTDGIIQSVEEGKQLFIELEDCTLMGYKVFGVKVAKNTVGDIRYALRGDVKAYVQFQQDMPNGFHRMGGWPTDVFDHLMPPSPAPSTRYSEKQLITKNLCEIAPFHWNGRLCHMECIRPATGGSAADYYLLFRDAQTGRELGRCAHGYGLGSILVDHGTAHVFASRFENGGWHDVTQFDSCDLKTWQQHVAVKEENEQLFNTSVCHGAGQYVMTYESNDPAYPAFTVKIATSPDLKTWTKRPESTFGTNRYTACPCIRYSRGYYYVLYLEHRTPRWWFETYITRSKDLRHWELSSANPVLRPEDLDDGVNASDPELIEHAGQTYVYYCVADQLTWANIKRVTYPGKLDDFLASWYRMPGVPDWGCPAYAAK